MAFNTRPGISGKGFFQAIELGKKIKRDGGVIKEIFTSPFTSCLKTAIYAYGFELQEGSIRVVARPEFQGVGSSPNNTGSDKSVLVEQYSP
jgi:broad specificity phosphatase PhoE